MKTKYLIITNGDSAVGALKAAHIQADFLPWQDVLHDGPVKNIPDLGVFSQERARFLTTMGWGTYDDIMASFIRRNQNLKKYKDYSEVILWFERDLYDQLQLLQIMNWFAQQDVNDTSLKVIHSYEFIALAEVEYNRHSFDCRKNIDLSTLETAKEGWNAFCCPEPISLQKFADRNLPELPFMSAALYRFFEEFPLIPYGLGQVQVQILKLINDGISEPGALFSHYCAEEESPFLGDWSFWHYLNQLIECNVPVVTVESQEQFLFPPLCKSRDDFMNQRILLTDFGQKVLKGEKSFLEKNTLDRWYGGVHVYPENYWCWNNVKCRFEKLK